MSSVITGLCGESGSCVVKLVSYVAPYSSSVCDTTTIDNLDSSRTALGLNSCFVCLLYKFDLEESRRENIVIHHTLIYLGCGWG